MKLSFIRALNYLTSESIIDSRKLKFNFECKNIYYSSRLIIKNGICAGEDFLGIELKEGIDFKEPEIGTKGFIYEMERLYGLYYDSGEPHRKGINFVARDIRSTDDFLDLLSLKGSDYDRLVLESFIFSVIVSGRYEWEFGDFWFWVSPKYPKLILYKKWFERSPNE